MFGDLLNPPLPCATSVKDPLLSKVKEIPRAVPLLQGFGELRRRDVQIDGHQRDADQTHMDPPLSHVELSGEALIPAPET